MDWEADPAGSSLQTPAQTRVKGFCLCQLHEQLHSLSRLLTRHNLSLVLLAQPVACSHTC